jgi:asparagine synthase (glutamine-hydrolysing)
MALPPDTAARRKQGFDVPLSDWLRGPLREVLTDFLDERTVRERGLFHPRAVTTLVSDHLERRVDHGERLWALIVLEGWMQATLDRRPAGQPR